MTLNNNTYYNDTLLDDARRVDAGLVVGRIEKDYEKPFGFHNPKTSADQWSNNT